MLDHITSFLVIVLLLSFGYKIFYTFWSTDIHIWSFWGYSWIQIEFFLPVKYVEGETTENLDRKIANIALYIFYISAFLLIMHSIYAHYRHPELYNKPRPVVVDSVEKPISDSEKAQLLDSMKQDLKYKRDY
jgi:hypothetical protein